MPRAPHPRPPIAPAKLNDRGRDARWTNLGDWRSARTYSEAGAALAMRVGHAARLRQGDVVVDYACGYGDSLRLWVESFGVAHVVGIEPDPAVATEVTRRVEGWGLADRITVRTARAESLSPREAAADVTAVVCVDAVYHFRTRADWIASVAAALPAGGRLGFSDLVLHDGTMASASLVATAAVMGIPGANLVDVGTLFRMCVAHGLVLHEHVALGHHVLDGFTAHAPGGGPPVWATRQALRWFRRRRALEYLILGAASGAP